MPDWIEDAAKRLREEKRQREEHQDWQRSVRGKLVAKSREVFSALLAVVENDVERFNTHFPEAETRLQKLERLGTMGFQVRRAYSPSFRLRVTFDAEAPLIKYEVIRANVVDGQSYATAGTFNFHLQDSGDVCLLKLGVPITCEEASRELLVPALEGLV